MIDTIGDSLAVFFLSMEKEGFFSSLHKTCPVIASFFLCLGFCCYCLGDHISLSYSISFAKLTVFYHKKSFVYIYLKKSYKLQPIL